MSTHYGKSVSTLRRKFERYNPPKRTDTVASEPVALTFDATFFGRGYGLLIYRATSRNIHWQEIQSETIAVIEQGLRHLTAQGWRFSSFTIDGRPGVVRLLEDLFPHTPIQLCVFHQKAIVRRYLTSKPKTICGQEIRSLVARMMKLDEAEFMTEMARIKRDFADFLKERNEQGQFSHRRLRSALRSLTMNAPYLYAWKRWPELAIPTTTNSCDGSFAHWKSKIKIHRGLAKKRRAKMIEFLLSNS